MAIRETDLPLVRIDICGDHKSALRYLGLVETYGWITATDLSTDDLTANQKIAVS